MTVCAAFDILSYAETFRLMQPVVHLQALLKKWSQGACCLAASLKENARFILPVSAVHITCPLYLSSSEFAV